MLLLYMWKWSNGESYTRSRRQSNVSNNNNNNNIIDMAINDNSFFNRDALSRRETMDEKISDRYMISQRGVNPFLKSDYVNDINVFMKPVNTSSDKST